MKILHICRSLDGGAGTAARRIHYALLEAGLDSSLMYLRSNKDVKNSVCCEYKTTLHSGDPYVILSDELSQAPVNYEIATYHRTNFDITTHPAYQSADIIHLHWVANYLDFPSFFRQNEKPIVWTLHDMNPFRGIFHYTDDEAQNLELSKFDAEVRGQKEGILNFLSISVVSPSTWLMSEAKVSYALKNSDHYCIPNALNTNVFRRYDQNECRHLFGVPKDKKVVLFVADHVANRRKGFDMLLDAFEHFDSDGYYFVAAGNRKYDQDIRIHFTGRIDDELQMAQLYSAADLFILPSRQDNLPNTMIESLCCGTPVVGFGVGGVAEYVVDGINGVICENVSSKSLAQGIERAKNTVFDHEKIQSDTHRKCSFSIIAKKYKELYDSIYNSNNVDV